MFALSYISIASVRLGKYLYKISRAKIPTVSIPCFSTRGTAGSGQFCVFQFVAPYEYSRRALILTAVNGNMRQRQNDTGQPPVRRTIYISILLIAKVLGLVTGQLYSWETVEEGAPIF